jgi:hypothetical protein
MFNLPDLLKRSVSIYAAHPGLLVAISSVGLPLGIASQVIASSTPQLVNDPWLAGQFWLAIVNAPFFVAGYIVSGAVIRAVAVTYHGSNPSFTNSYRAVLTRVRGVLGVGIVYWAATNLLWLTIVGTPIAIYLLVRWFFALQAVVIEDLGTGEALSLSSRLVKGIWWRLAGVLLLIVALFAAPLFAMFFLLQPTHLAYVLIASAVAVVLAPLFASFSTLLFFRLRERQNERAPIPVLP